MTGADSRRLRALTRIVAGLLVVGGLVVARQAMSGHAPAAAITPAPPTTAVTTPAPTTSTVPPPAVPVSTMLASPKGTIPAYAAPGTAASGKIGLWYGYAMTLPVMAAHDGWLQVRLPQRPNGSTAWVQASDVTLSTSSYRIVISVGSERLRVYRNGYQTMDFPVGVGTPSTPTPTGHFFVTVRVPPPNSAYGPFVVSTSAHSEAISSWEGAGDALIGIHGPISGWADSRIGSGNARISNGCVRMHNADLAQLAVIPAGTPIDIIAA